MAVTPGKRLATLAAQRKAIGEWAIKEAATPEPQS
jgi:hypothetical protein